MAHYIHDEKNNRIEGMSKEEIYALLAAAIQEGQLPSVDQNTAFVTMFKSIVDGKTYKMAFCTQAQYNQLEAQGELVADAYYIITDDTSYNDIINSINNLNNTDANLLAAIANLGERVTKLEKYNHLIYMYLNFDDTIIWFNIQSTSDTKVVDFDTLLDLLNTIQQRDPYSALNNNKVFLANGLFESTTPIMSINFEILLDNSICLFISYSDDTPAQIVIDDSSSITFIDFISEV